MLVKNKRKKLSLKKRIVFTFLALILCFLFMEVSMIIMEPHLFHGFYQYDPDLGFRVRAFARGSNRFGFFDREYPLEKIPDSFRILVLGDSFGWSNGLNGNYTALLDKMFENRFGANRVDVINSGYPMTHTGEQLMVLKKFALRYNPDCLLLGFFAGNDFIDADPNRKRIVLNDVYFDIDKRNEFTLFGYPIVFKSRLVEFIRQKFIILKEQVKASSGSKEEKESRQKHLEGSIIPFPPSFFPGNREDARNEKKQDLLSDETFLLIERNKMKFCRKTAHENGEYDENIRFIFDSIAEMQQILEERKIDFIVGIYPDEFQVNEELREKIFIKYELDREDYDIELMQKLLKDFLDSKGITHIDLLDEFRAEGNKTPLYKPLDPHWSQKGDRLAAKILFRELQKLVDFTR